MFCPNCGSQVAQDTRFCPMCGHTINAAPAASVAPVAPTLQQTPSNGFADRVREAVRFIGSSPLFLVITCLYTLLQLVSFLSIGYSSSSMFESLYPMLREMGMSASDIREMSQVFSSGTGIVSLFSMIPSILIMSGLWMIYGTSVGRSKRISTAGYTMIQVITIIQLVFIGIALLIGFIVLLAAFVGLNASHYATDEALTILAIVLTVYIAVAVFVFVYYIKICTTLSKVKTTLHTGTPNRYVSGFVAVICFILGAFNAISGLTILLNTVDLDDFTAGVLLNRLPSLFYAAIQIMVGVLIFIYKSRMSALEYEESQLGSIFNTQPQAQPVYHTVPQTLYQPPVVPAVDETPVVEYTPYAEEADEIIIDNNTAPLGETVVLGETTPLE